MANGGGGSGPPNKFPQWIDLGVFPNTTDRAVALGNAYDAFYAAYHVWPTDAVTVGSVVYLGAYGKKN